MLHLLNGDATAAIMPDGLPGERAVWRDIMMEGPPVPDGAERGAWLAPRLGVSVDDYARGWRDGETTLARAREHDEVVLWFEQDLFCAVNLWYVLDRLGDRPQRIALVFPALGDGFDGLGWLAPDDFPRLFEQRTPLDAVTRDSARALWRAWASPDPTALGAVSGVPFAARAARLHRGRFPSIARGLDEVEHAALRGLAAGGSDFGALFSVATRPPPLNALGLGDVQFAGLLRDLAGGERPLVRIEDRDAPFARWRVSITDAGHAVLSGAADRLALSALDRWLGGVHLVPSAPAWRRDEGSGALVRPA